MTINHSVANNGQIESGKSVALQNIVYKNHISSNNQTHALISIFPFFLACALDVFIVFKRDPAILANYLS